MTEIEKLREERQQLWENLFNMRMPSRVPVFFKVTNEFAIQYAGKDMFDYQWHPEKLFDAGDAVCSDLFSDINPFGTYNLPAVFTLLECRHMIMSDKGILQHPEVVPMLPEEYDEFIACPLDYIVEKQIPRGWGRYNTSAEYRSIAFMQNMLLRTGEYAKIQNIGSQLSQKHGYPVFKKRTTIFNPFDYFADYFRGFTGISLDMRRYPDKVAAAIEALTPLIIERGLTDDHDRMSECYIPMHMPPYMSTKDFERFYWPSFRQTVQEISDNGQSVLIFAQNNWERYLDHFQELPRGVRIRFEYGDPQFIKDKLGKDKILAGFYPYSLISSGTKDECTDKLKELLDILMPGGNYYFDFDKVSATYSGGKENFMTVLSYIYENAGY